MLVARRHRQLAGLPRGRQRRRELGSGPKPVGEPGQRDHGDHELGRLLLGHAGLQRGGEHDDDAAAERPDRKLHGDVRRLEPAGEARGRLRHGGRVRSTTAPTTGRWPRTTAEARCRRRGIITTRTAGKWSRSGWGRVPTRPTRTGSTCGASGTSTTWCCGTGTRTPTGRWTSGSTRLQDANWNVIGIASDTGDVQERYAYQAYGTPKFLSPAFAGRSSSSYAWESLYAAYRYDPVSGLYAVRNRYLNPALGTWVSRDPVGYEAGTNLAAYCGQVPLIRTDSMGLAGAVEGFDDLGYIIGGGFYGLGKGGYNLGAGILRLGYEIPTTIIDFGGLLGETGSRYTLGTNWTYTPLSTAGSEWIPVSTRTLSSTRRDRGSSIRAPALLRSELTTLAPHCISIPLQVMMRFCLKRWARLPLATSWVPKGCRERPTAACRFALVGHGICPR